MWNGRGGRRRPGSRLRCWPSLERYLGIAGKKPLDARPPDGRTVLIRSRLDLKPPRKREYYGISDGRLWCAGYWSEELGMSLSYPGTRIDFELAIGLSGLKSSYCSFGDRRNKPGGAGCD